MSANSKHDSFETPADRLSSLRNRRRPGSQHSKEALAAAGFLTPNLIGFMIFTFIPVFASFAMAFTNWDLFRTPRWVGFFNFASLLGWHYDDYLKQTVMNDPFFWKYVYNTVFMMLAIPLGIAGSLCLALLMNQKIRGITLFRTVYFLPTVCSGVAILVLWKWLYNDSIGLINTLIRAFGDLVHINLTGPDWLGDSSWAKPALMLMGLWTGLGGFNMILYLAALQGVPRELYEAAAMDGAGSWKSFWAVTWPSISPTTFFILIMSVIGGFQGGFMQANVMTGGGPAGSTTTIEYYIYNIAFTRFLMGYASAIAWVLFVVILGLTLVTWRMGGKVVHYA
ncbi:MAG: sugar ABC transporter permease [Armatimonadetes bacterium]|nr:sugar ABC transporter permease [Armatimonadota bacterium]